MGGPGFPGFPLTETVRQPTSDLAEVTSLSFGGPPSGLPGERDLRPALNSESASFRWQGDAARWSHKPYGRCGKQSLQDRGDGGGA